ncbi:WD-40 repeat-containing protein [Infundibulicybe gibba]|nr:WD-40 repeat-containing protein [Infundibulicybe gibba]
MEAPPPAHLLRSHTTPITALAFSPDNERLYSGETSGRILITSTRSLRALALWPGHSSSILGIEEWADSIITHARDDKIRVWTRVVERPLEARLGGTAALLDLPVPEMKYEMDVNALNYCRFSLLPCADGTALIALPNLVDSTVADVWSLPSRDRIHAAVGLDGKVRSTLFSSNPEGRNTSGIIMSLHLYRTSPASPSSSTASELRLLTAYESGTVILRKYSRTDKPKSVEGLGWDVIWNVRVHVESVMAMRVSRDNTFALTISADHIVGKYDLTNGAPPQKEKSLHRTKHPGNGCISIRDDGKVCAVGGWDGKIRLYATRAFKPLGTLKYHKTGCQALEFARSLDRVPKPDLGVQDDHDRRGDEDEDEEMSAEEKAARARWLVSGGKDGRVAVWALIDFDRG